MPRVSDQTDNPDEVHPETSPFLERGPLFNFQEFSLKADEESNIFGLSLQVQPSVDFTVNMRITPPEDAEQFLERLEFEH